MIISRTPLRISFVGSDLVQNGAVISSTINKYMYVSVNRKFDGKLKVAYSKTEIVDTVDVLEHDLARASLTLLNLKDGLEITSVCDIPSGTGLGSSSAYTVGLLNALHRFKGENIHAEQLAEEACEVEINMCGRPIGKQDQYAVSFGGLNYLEFNDEVDIYQLYFDEKKLEERLLLFYVGQREETYEKNGSFKERANLAKELKKELVEDNLDNFEDYLNCNWELKRECSTPEIDKLYEIGMEYAEGGKLLGAGGGGFLLFYAPKEKHEKIIKSLPLRNVPFSFENEGSRIIYED